MSENHQNNHKKQILVVENDSIIALNLKNRIKQWEYAVEYALSEEKAFEVFEHQGPFDLILMNIDFAANLGSASPIRQILDDQDLPIIFLVSYPDMEIPEKLRAIENYGFVLNNAGDVMLQSSIEIGFELFKARRKIPKGEIQNQEELEKSLAEKKEMLREIQHRVKNNMATIRSLFNIQLGYMKNAEHRSVLEKVITRLLSMEVLYIQLYKSNEYKYINIKDYLVQLVDDMRSVVESKSYINISQELEEMRIEAHQVFPLGIIFGELFSNALLHGFKPGDSGELHITLSSKDDIAILEFYDNGIGIKDFVPNETRAGFGLTLVELLVQQLDGTLEITGSNGTRVRISFTPN